MGRVHACFGLASGPMEGGASQAIDGHASSFLYISKRLRRRDGEAKRIMQWHILGSHISHMYKLQRRVARLTGQTTDGAPALSWRLSAAGAPSARVIERQAYGYAHGDGTDAATHHRVLLEQLGGL